MKERLKQLKENFWAETNEPWTEEWRDELTPEEAALVETWDDRVATGPVWSRLSWT